MILERLYTLQNEIFINLGSFYSLLFTYTYLRHNNLHCTGCMGCCMGSIVWLCCISCMGSAIGT
ncbi:hypothetical protein F5Y12DRAFT_747089 [Xylaria sp. FL1777]|nr:hypothetical protein F5Y12DRAFT_747089 [Xylaria sp. FL1777]